MRTYYFLSKNTMGQGNRHAVFYFDLGGNDIIKLEYWDNAGELEFDTGEIIDREIFSDEVILSYSSVEYIKKRKIPSDILEYQLMEKVVKFIFSSLFMRRR